MHYKHRQIGYLMLAVMLGVLILFVWMYIAAAKEPPSVDSGPNLLITALMVLIYFALAYFTWKKLKK